MWLLADLRYFTLCKLFLWVSKGEPRSMVLGNLYNDFYYSFQELCLSSRKIECHMEAMIMVFIRTINIAMNLCIDWNDDTCDWPIHTHVHGVTYMALNAVDCPVPHPTYYHTRSTCTYNYACFCC